MPVGASADSAGVKATWTRTARDLTGPTRIAGLVGAQEQTQTMVCYRHPRSETAVSCSSCGRPICTDCMVFASVGIKCPECAGQPTGAKKTAKSRAVQGGRTAGARGDEGADRPDGDRLRGPDRRSPAASTSSAATLFVKGALFGPAVAQGDW